MLRKTGPDLLRQTLTRLWFFNFYVQKPFNLGSNFIYVFKLLYLVNIFLGCFRLLQKNTYIYQITHQIKKNTHRLIEIGTYKFATFRINYQNKNLNLYININSQKKIYPKKLQTFEFSQVYLVFFKKKLYKCFCIFYYYNIVYMFFYYSSINLNVCYGFIISTIIYKGTPKCYRSFFLENFTIFNEKIKNQYLIFLLDNLNVDQCEQLKKRSVFYLIFIWFFFKFFTIFASRFIETFSCFVNLISYDENKQLRFSFKERIVNFFSKENCKIVLNNYLHRFLIRLNNFREFTIECFEVGFKACLINFTVQRLNFCFSNYLNLELTTWEQINKLEISCSNYKTLKNNFFFIFLVAIIFLLILILFTLLRILLIFLLYWFLIKTKMYNSSNGLTVCPEPFYVLVKMAREANFMIRNTPSHAFTTFTRTSKNLKLYNHRFIELDDTDTLSLIEKNTSPAAHFIKKLAMHNCTSNPSSFISLTTKQITNNLENLHLGKKVKHNNDNILIDQYLCVGNIVYASNNVSVPFEIISGREKQLLSSEMVKAFDLKEKQIIRYFYYLKRNEDLVASHGVKYKLKTAAQIINEYNLTQVCLPFYHDYLWNYDFDVDLIRFFLINRKTKQIFSLLKNNNSDADMLIYKNSYFKKLEENPLFYIMHSAEQQNILLNNNKTFNDLYPMFYSSIEHSIHGKLVVPKNFVSKTNNLKKNLNENGLYSQENQIKTYSHINLMHTVQKDLICTCNGEKTAVLINGNNINSVLANVDQIVKHFDKNRSLKNEKTNIIDIDNVD